MENLKDLLDWMDDNFNGSLTELRKKAVKKAKAEELISGPLWDEIGEWTLHKLYRHHRIIPRRNQTVKGQEQEIVMNEATADDTTKKSMKTTNRVKLYPIDGEYYDLLNLTKEQVLRIAEKYDKLAKSNAYERNFLTEIAGNLKEGQQVKEVYSIEDIRELRKGKSA